MYNKEKRLVMSLFSTIFGDKAVRDLSAQQKADFRFNIDQLVRIGQTDDFLSLVPGGLFNYQCHHKEARELGQKIEEMGGLPLMMAARKIVKRKLGENLAEHLDHAWKEIGDWKA